jgi:hypothetical protein
MHARGSVRLFVKIQYSDHSGYAFTRIILWRNLQTVAVQMPLRLGYTNFRLCQYPVPDWTTACWHPCTQPVLRLCYIRLMPAHPDTTVASMAVMIAHRPINCPARNSGVVSPLGDVEGR